MSNVKVGDSIRVIMPGEDINGLEGQVVEVLEDGMWPVKAKFFAPGYGDLTWVFFEDELEILDD